MSYRLLTIVACCHLTCAMMFKPPEQLIDKCATEAGVSEAGKSKVKEIYKNSMKEPKLSIHEFRKTFHKVNEDTMAALKETDGDKASAFRSCLANLARFEQRCAASVGISPAGIAKIQEAFKIDRSGGKDGEKPGPEKRFQNMKAMRAKFPKMIENAKHALEETDKDKANAWESCMKERPGRRALAGLAGKAASKDDTTKDDEHTTDDAPQD